LYLIKLKRSPFEEIAENTLAGKIAAVSAKAEQTTVDIV
jgi:hypothetical protein